MPVKRTGSTAQAQKQRRIKRYSKVQKPKRKRFSPGAEIARPLVEWLNQAKAAAAKGDPQARESLARIASFIPAATKYAQQCAALDKLSKAKTATDEEVWKTIDKELDAQDELTAEFDRYNFALIPVRSGRSRILRLTARSHGDSFVCYVHGFMENQIFREVDAAKTVYELSQKNYRNLRVCKRKKCRRFFYPSKRTQKFCPGGACRVAWHHDAAKKPYSLRKPKRRAHK
jgi:hypothetical protein